MRRYMKLLAGVCVTICLTVTGCQRTNTDQEFFIRASNILEETKSGGIQTSFVLRGSISGVEETPFIVEITGDGVVVTDPDFKESWNYDSTISIFRETEERRYDVATFSDDNGSLTAIREGLSEWQIVDLATETVEDPLLRSAYREASEDIYFNDEIGYTTVISGDALERLVSLALNADNRYDLSVLDLKHKQADGVFLLTETCEPVSVSIDCRTFANQMAEVIAGKSGIRITIKQCYATISFSDLGMITDVTLPEIFDEAELY